MLSPSEASQPTVSGLLSALKRQRGVLLISVAICFILAVAVCIFMTPMYSATSEIQIAKTASGGLGLDNMVSQADNSTDELAESITLQTMSNILKSDSLALSVIENLNLEHTKDFKPIFNPINWVLGLISPSGPKDPANAPLADAPTRRTRVLKRFAKYLKIEPVAGTRLIDISYESSDPVTAAKVVNQLTAALVNYGYESRSAANAQGTQWLGGQLNDVKKQAEDLQQKVVQLQKDSGIYGLGGGGQDSAYNLTLDRLKQGTESIGAAQSQRILKGEIYEMVKNKDPELLSGLAGAALNGASPGVMNSFNLIQSLRTQEATLESQVAVDSSKYGQANPKLKDEQASLASIKKQIQDEAVRIGERAANDYHVAQATENALEVQYNHDKGDANKLNDKAMEFTIAQQEANEARQLYQTLFSRMKEADVVQGLQSSNVTVVDPGRVPSKPSKPNVPLYLGGSIVAGLFFGTLVALFLEVTNDRIQSFRPVVQELEVPLMGALPSMVDGRGLSLPGLKQKRLPAMGHSGVFPNLAVLEAPGSPFAEALRALRTSLQHPRRGDGVPPKVILITSSVPQEGKSTVSANLATLLALSGERVLLIDGDMRQPSMPRSFGPAPRPDVGLSTMLSGSSNGKGFPIDDVPEIPGLHLLRSGPVPRFPAELLGKNRMQSLIEDLKPSFDHIVIDSPPVLAATDATIVSHFADLTLLVVREDLTTLRSLRRTNEILSAHETAELGVVLNGVGRRSDSYQDYVGYSGSDGYSDRTNSAHASVAE